MKIFFSVGEPSGDVHGANLIRALKAEFEKRRGGSETDSNQELKANQEQDSNQNLPDKTSTSETLDITGFGGPKMAAAGCRLQFDLTSLAVMWIGRVLWNIRKFFRLADEAEAYFKKEKPNAVVLIDYPGFNWHIAKRAHKAGIPVFYYSPPQIWGWACWRVKKMRNWVDYALSGLEFEARWLNDRGCRCQYVGHPFFDETANKCLDLDWIRAHFPDREAAVARRFCLEESCRQATSADEAHVGNIEMGCRTAELIESTGGPPRPIVAILPGSRSQEVQSNLDSFLSAAQKIADRFPQVRFVVAAFREKHRVEIEEKIKQKLAGTNLDVRVFVEKTPEIMALSDAVMSVSGSVSLELLYYLKPTVILYRVSRFGLFVQSLFRKVKYITLVNLLRYSAVGLQTPDSDAAPNPRSALFPEFLTAQDESAAIASQIGDWLEGAIAPESDFGTALRTRLKELEQLREQVCQPGAASKAAQIIFDRARRDVPQT